MTRGVRLIAVLTLLGSLLVGDQGKPVLAEEPYWLGYIRVRSSRLVAWDPQHVYTTFLREPEGQVGLAVCDPVTGAAALLAVPDRSYASVALDLSTDRGLWLGTRDPELVALQVSLDRGVSWRPSAPPWATGPGITRAVEIAAPDGTLYLGATRVPGGEVLIARSSDDGRTWETLAPTGLPTGAPLLQLEVLADGGLVAVNGPVRSWLRFSVSRDGGRTFSDLAVRGFPRSNHTLRALPGGGYLTSGASRIPHPDLLLVSDDLRAWRRLSPPQT